MQSFQGVIKTTQCTRAEIRNPTSCNSGCWTVKRYAIRDRQKRKQSHSSPEKNPLGSWAESNSTPSALHRASCAFLAQHLSRGVVILVTFTLWQCNALKICKHHILYYHALFRAKANLEKCKKPSRLFYRPVGKDWLFF